MTPTWAVPGLLSDDNVWTLLTETKPLDWPVETYGHFLQKLNHWTGQWKLKSARRSRFENIALYPWRFTLWPPTLWRFTKEEAKCSKKALPFYDPARYIGTFDVTSVVNCISLRTRQRFENIALYPNYDVISEVNCVLLRRKWRFEIIAVYPNFDVIPEVNCVLLTRRLRFEKSAPM